jgi:hypothetical protein
MRSAPRRRNPKPHRDFQAAGGVFPLARCASVATKAQRAGKDRGRVLRVRARWEEPVHFRKLPIRGARLTTANRATRVDACSKAISQRGRLNEHRNAHARNAEVRQKDQRSPPSPTYSGERGRVLPESHYRPIRRSVTDRRVERFIDVERRSPLSPTLSPEYRGEGVNAWGPHLSAVRGCAELRVPTPPAQNEPTALLRRSFGLPSSSGILIPPG